MAELNLKEIDLSKERNTGRDLEVKRKKEMPERLMMKHGSLIRASAMFPLIRGEASESTPKRYVRGRPGSATFRTSLQLSWDCSYGCCWDSGSSWEYSAAERISVLSLSGSLKQKPGAILRIYYELHWKVGLWSWDQETSTDWRNSLWTTRASRWEKMGTISCGGLEGCKLVG